MYFRTLRIRIYKKIGKSFFVHLFWVGKSKTKIRFFFLSAVDLGQWKQLLLEALSFVFKLNPFQVGLKGKYFFLLSQQNEKVDFSKCMGFSACHKQKFRYQQSIRCWEFKVFLFYLPYMWTKCFLQIQRFIFHFLNFCRDLGEKLNLEK
jgi:hypothetical protein